MKASECIQSLIKTIQNFAEPFEGSGFYWMAEPSLAEPFFQVPQRKKGSIEKIQNPDGSGLNSNGSVLHPDVCVLNPIVSD